ncbi:AIPR family protein [Burkholderia gladioli]|uniref:AIPR family protein n=1 Tax=Burkholderia gladioli TaxID=28095 RepID=UPI00163F758E|nr:AIPR family protein [Burkholderia gladioli]
MRYDILIRILDEIRNEAPFQQSSRYRPDSSDIEKINQARARAFIHLYMKVMFGISDFSARERTITDASADGGVDGYYIDIETKTIYLIQSKFRVSERNFESKEIELEELLMMDISRIMEGETADEAGTEYNGKIKQLQREISSLPDVARFSYRVVILANLKSILPSRLMKLTGGYAAEVFNFEKTYEELVFPVITGTYYTASDIVIPIDLSNKNAGSKISYNVSTKYGECEITVLFVPTIEVARLMDKYRNSILKYNPRSYLEFEGHAVNASIRDTIVQSETNEFSLFNNGITMLSDETNINEKIGQKNKAQLWIKNPQIINGGQTSFTLSRILSENRAAAEEIFKNKEVLLKVITLFDSESQLSKLELIDEISNATNKQTPVINADRFANEQFHIKVQQLVFERFGLLYERKRGEFSAGVNDGYVDAKTVIERNLFWRIYYAANGQIDRGAERRLFKKNKFSDVDLDDREKFDRANVGLNLFGFLRRRSGAHEPRNQNIYAKIFLYIELFYDVNSGTNALQVQQNLTLLEQRWSEFGQRQIEKFGPRRRAYIDNQTGEAKIRILDVKFEYGPSFRNDLSRFIADTKSASGTAAVVTS